MTERTIERLTTVGICLALAGLAVRCVPAFLPVGVALSVAGALAFLGYFLAGIAVDVAHWRVHRRLRR